MFGMLLTCAAYLTLAGHTKIPRSGRVDFHHPNPNPTDINTVHRGGLVYSISLRVKCTTWPRDHGSHSLWFVYRPTLQSYVVNDEASSSPCVAVCYMHTSCAKLGISFRDRFSYPTSVMALHIEPEVMSLMTDGVDISRS